MQQLKDDSKDIEKRLKDSGIDFFYRADTIGAPDYNDSIRVKRKKLVI